MCATFYSLRCKEVPGDLLVVSEKFESADGGRRASPGVSDEVNIVVDGLAFIYLLRILIIIHTIIYI